MMFLGSSKVALLIDLCRRNFETPAAKLHNYEIWEFGNLRDASAQKKGSRWARVGSDMLLHMIHLFLGG